MVEGGPGGRFELRRPFKLGRDAPAKMAARDIRPDEVRALLDDHVIVDIVVLADDELDDATVLVSVYEPDAAHGWTTERIERTLSGDTGEEPR